MGSIYIYIYIALLYWNYLLKTSSLVTWYQRQGLGLRLNYSDPSDPFLFPWGILLLFFWFGLSPPIRSLRHRLDFIHDNPTRTARPTSSANFICMWFAVSVCAASSCVIRVSSLRADLPCPAFWELDFPWDLSAHLFPL